MTDFFLLFFFSFEFGTSLTISDGNYRSGDLRLSTILDTTSAISSSQRMIPTRYFTKDWCMTGLMLNRLHVWVAGVGSIMNSVMISYCTFICKRIVHVSLSLIAGYKHASKNNLDYA